MLGLIDYDYLAAIEDARQKDIDGDLGYTIHVDTATEICATIEGKYAAILAKLVENHKGDNVL
jgi:hypothetical protein